MATLTIKRVPDELYEKLKAMAKRRRRSINSQVIVLLEAALDRTQPDEPGLIEQIRSLRERAGGTLNEAERQAARHEGRE